MDLIRAENDQAIHFATTPIRVLYRVLALLGLLGLATCYFFISQTGWIVDVGPRSERARIDQINSLGASLIGDYNSSRKMVDVTVNFAYRARGGDEQSYPGQPWHGQDHFWVTEEDYVTKGQGIPGVSTDPESKYRTLNPFQLSDERAITPLRGFPFCHVGHSGMYETALGPWSERPDTILDRKSARMHRDFETAAIMVAALRSALAHLKAGQDLRSEYGPASGKPLENSYCNADGADPTVLSPAQLAAYRAATWTIALHYAPSVTFRYVYFPTSEASIEESEDPAVQRAEQWADQGMKIVGMCDYCDRDTALKYGTTLYADLFANDPPLSDVQIRTERELLKTASMDWWLMQARMNGVTETSPLYAENLAARRDLATIFGDPPPTN
jgi:hypothetical protein